MLTSKLAWQVIEKHAPRGAWLELADLYGLVTTHVSLDDADLAGVSEKTASARWKRTVRNELQRQKARGAIEWDGKGKYRLGRT